MRIWGIPDELESLSRDRLAKEIADRHAQISWIYEDMKYADGGSYSQDHNRIALIQREINALQAVYNMKDILAA